MIQQTASDLTKLNQDDLIELWEIDATDPSIGGSVTRLCNQEQAIGMVVKWQGNEYQPFPVRVTDVDMNGRGVSSRPVLTLGNATSFITTLLVFFQDMLGAKVTRRRVLAKYLDGMPSANTSAGLPDDIWTIQRKNSETMLAVEFELSSPMDLDEVMIPFMRVNATHCQVRLYRGPECSYTGLPKTAGDGTTLTPTNDRGVYSAANTYAVGDYFYVTFEDSRFYYVTQANAPAETPLSNRYFFQPDVCGRRLSDCVLHFGQTAVLPFLAFPGTQRLPAS